MILYKPDSSISDYELQGKLFLKYVRVVQFKNFNKVAQLKTDEYIKEVQRRYKRRYNIKNIILNKIRGILK